MRKKKRKNKIIRRQDKTAREIADLTGLTIPQVYARIKFRNPENLEDFLGDKRPLPKGAKPKYTVEGMSLKAYCEDIGFPYKKAWDRANLGRPEEDWFVEGNMKGNQFKNNIEGYVRKEKDFFS